MVKTVVMLMQINPPTIKQAQLNIPILHHTNVVFQFI